MTVHECKTPSECFALSSACRVRTRLNELVGAFHRLYPRLAGKLRGLPDKDTCPCDYVSRVKSFCSGLVEGASHPWREPLKSLGRKQRLSVAGSLFLFRKVLPTRPPSLARWKERMEEESPIPSEEFVSFAVKQVRKLFPKGWDSRYPLYVDKMVANPTSCFESPRREGGLRGLLASERSPWCEATCKEIASLARPGSLEFGKGKVATVDTGGKVRVITTPPKESILLKPLQEMMYDHLSKKSWLLRGDAKPRSFSGFTRKDGEVFVSGDYASATDNLNHHVQVAILNALLDECSLVPEGIKEIAIASLSMTVFCPALECTFVQRRGQLMGNIISFPLLCLVNYIAFKWAVPRKVPLKINGDDIVFRCTPEERSTWFRLVGESGLVLSPGKTMVDGRFFSLNSSWFDARKNLVRLVPVIRSKPLFGCVDEGLRSIEGRYHSFCPGFGRGAPKRVLAEIFLRCNRRFVTVSDRSVRNGLCLPVLESDLSSSGLLRREQSYLNVDGRYCSEVRLSDVERSIGRYRPEGWRLSNSTQWGEKQVKEWQREYAREVRSLMWVTACPVLPELESFKDRVRESGVSTYGSIMTSRRLKLFSKLSGVSRRDADRFLRCKFALPKVERVHNESWWIPAEYFDRRRIVFKESSGNR